MRENFLQKVFPHPFKNFWHWAVEQATLRGHCEEREARRGNLYRTQERPAAQSPVIPNAQPHVMI
jgi:hypothetical protein